MRPHPAGGPRPTVARPGDPDLTWDLFGVVLDIPVVVDRHLWLGFAAQRGRVSDGTYNSAIRTGVSFHIPSLADEMFDALIAQLDEWAEARTPLRLVAAPGRPGAFYAADGTAMAMPSFG